MGSKHYMEGAEKAEEQQDCPGSEGSPQAKLQQNHLLNSTAQVSTMTNECYNIPAVQRSFF